MDIKIHPIHFTADQKLLDYAEKKISKLEQFYDRIIGCEVFMKLENAHSNIKEKSVNIKLKVPGDTLDAEEHSNLFEAAIDEAVESMKRQLVKHKEKQRK